MEKVKYSDEVVYFISYSKLPNNTPASHALEHVGCGLFIEPSTGVVVDISCTLLTPETRSFLKYLIVGFNLDEEPLDKLLNKIKTRYFGLAQKAICTSLKETYGKYKDWKKQNNLN